MVIFFIKEKSHTFDTSENGLRLYGDGDFKSGLEKLGKISKRSIWEGFKLISE